ncbi:MAG: GTPase ObgE [Phycisphaerales bacterium]|jgi:GTP-binding protein|nr:GTPase ObgE [Phycisphaerales bacterium]
MFIDEAVIHVRGGDGGDGAVSFKRSMGLPKGGPDGGDGGRGGDVVAVADTNASTLMDFRGQHHWEAPRGENGSSKQMTGRGAEDLEIRLPAGTLLIDERTGEVIHDLQPNERFVLAQGGRGGFGNEHYKSPTNQAPRTALPGEKGEERLVRLKLKLIADVGLVGMPNAGKSTLLRCVTRARPKVGDYPFTTLNPQLGIAELDATRRFVIADIPGLIEGAAGGAGLGHEFLRHVERTRVLVHLLDAMPTEGTPAEHYRTIREELSQYSAALAEKPEIIALNKMDLFGDEASREEAVRELRSELRLGHDTPVVAISGATGFGMNALLELLWKRLGKEGDGGEWAA